MINIILKIELTTSTKSTTTTKKAKTNEDFLTKSLPAHNGNIYNLAVLQNRYLVSCSADRSIKIWRINENMSIECVKHLNGHMRYISSILFNTHENELISCSGDKTIRIWRLVDGCDVVECVKTLKSHKDDIVSILLISNSSTTLISGSYDATIKVWCLKRGLESLIFI